MVPSGDGVDESISGSLEEKGIEVRSVGMVACTSDGAQDPE